MVNTCIYFYVHEFIDDLMYFNEKYGDTFECDGDNLEVLQHSIEVKRMSFTEYVIACERLVFDMKTFHWFIIKDLIKPYKQGVTPEAFIKSFYS